MEITSVFCAGYFGLPISTVMARKADAQQKPDVAIRSDTLSEANTLLV